MKKFWQSLAFYIQKYPARLSGYMSAISLNAMKYWTNVPTGLLIPIAMILIMIGEGSQRLEDKKTLHALYTQNDPEKQDEEILAEMIKHLNEAEGRKNVRSKRSRTRTKSS
jgi:hypothetical protein